MNFTFNISQLIEQYGYLMVMVGSLAEGETIALLAGVFSHEKLIRYDGAVLSVMIGGFLGDQLLFYIGRYCSSYMLNRFKKYRKKLKRANSLIHRHPELFIIGVRFIYGFRIIGPIIIGISRVHALKFLLFNIVGACLWAVIFVTLGYFAGEVIAPWLNHIHHYFRNLIYLIMAIVLLILLFRLAYHYFSCRSNSK